MNTLYQSFCASGIFIWCYRYSSTSVYTELRDGKRADDDGSRLLTIENHLGVGVTVTLEEQDTTPVGITASARSRVSRKPVE